MKKQLFFILGLSMSTGLMAMDSLSPTTDRAFACVKSMEESMQKRQWKKAFNRFEKWSQSLSPSTAYTILYEFIQIFPEELKGNYPNLLSNMNLALKKLASRASSVFKTISDSD